MTFVDGVAVRELPVWVLGGAMRALTGVNLVPLIDGVFIFSAGRRTLHDRLAGTMVVQTDEAPLVTIDAHRGAGHDDYLDEL